MRRKTISMSQLAKNPEVVARDIGSGAIYRIKRPGQRGLLLMDEEYFEGWMVVVELMHRPNWREELEQSKRDSAAGRGRTLDEIEQELDRDRQVPASRRRAASRSAAASRAKGTRRSARSRGRAA